MTATGFTGGDPRKLNRSGYALGQVVAADAAGDLTAVPADVDGLVLTLDASEAAGVDWEPGGTAGRETWLFSLPGVLVPTVGTLRAYNRSGVPKTIHGCWAAVGTPPAGQAVIVDVLAGGLTIYTTVANRPSAPAGSNGGAVTAPDVTVLADGDYLTVDVVQVGAGPAGSDLTVGAVVSG